ncbi:MAG: hypothetical protein KA190_00190 [Kofleriaceae bacterium]|nr:hypothetical protein [Kofleriaceae bacterium]
MTSSLNLVRIGAVLAATVAGCGGGAPAERATSVATTASDCDRYVTRVQPGLTRLAARSHDAAAAPSGDELRASCQDAARPPAMDCILAADDDGAVDACLEAEYGRPRKRRVTEAQLVANRLGKSSKNHFVEMAAYPTGDTDWTPATPCCGQAQQRCAVDLAAWQAEPWRSLDFTVEEPHQVRVKYRGTASAYTATFWTDDDCDGAEDPAELLILRGTAVDGNPSLQITAGDTSR